MISSLHKQGFLYVTSLFPKPTVCEPCQLSKSQRLSFELNPKRSLHPLDLMNCDLWGPTLALSDGY